MTRYAKYKKKFNDSEFSGTSKPSVSDFVKQRQQGRSSAFKNNNNNHFPKSDSKKICLKCRKPGHTMSSCPQSKSVQTYCYNCGESDHGPKDCALPFSNYAHALCFLCDTKGHLASACPKNERGVYPNGGCCHFCGSVKHLARNCKPAQAAKNGGEVLVSAAVDVKANPEDDDVHEALTKIQASREQKPEKKKKKFSAISNPVMYYSVLADDCVSFEELQNFSGAVKLVLNFGKPSEVEQKYLNFAISSKSRLKFSENLGIELSSQPQPNSTGILDSSFASLPVTLVQSQLQANQVLLPSCVVCMSRLDRNVTGLSPLTCRDLYHFCCQQQCRLLSSDCAVCFSISNEQKVSCADCGSVDDLWICLLCGNVGCGRYRGGHAHDHFEAKRHGFALNSESHHIWDYQDDRYVHRTIRCAQGIVAIEEIEPGDDVGEESSFSAELSTAQLESQKAFFDERLRLQEAHFTRLIAAKEVEYAEELQKVKTELEHLQRERLVFSELKSQLQARLQQQKAETERFSKDFEAEKLISAGLVKRNDELQQQVEALCAERDELNEQIVDLMKHFETLELVAQAGNSSEIVNGKIVIKPSAASKKSASKKKS